MLTFAVLIILCYFFTQAAGYFVHKLLHCKATKRLYKSHHMHHENYPPEDYLSKEYRFVPLADRPIYYYLVAISVISSSLYFILPFNLFIALTAEMIAIAWLSDWIHTQLHIRGHWLERFDWFLRLRDLHLEHHVDEKKNIGIFSWFTDRIMGSFINTDTKKA